MTKSLSNETPEASFSRSFLRALIPVLILLLGLGGWSAWALIEAQLAGSRTDQAAALRIWRTIALDKIGSNLEKVLAIAGDPMLGPALADDAPTVRQGLEVSLQTLLLRNREFDRVTWIDEQGRQRAAAERDDHGTVLAVGAGALPDGLTQEFIAAAMRLRAGQILISPMGREAGRGARGPPVQAVLQLATAVLDASGQPHGVVIITSDATALIAQFPRHQTGGSQLMWLDEAGNRLWLPASDAGEHVPPTQTNPVATAHPDVWRAMTETKQTTYRYAEGLWTWTDLDPRKADFGAAVRQAPRWRLVSWLPADQIHARYLAVASRVAPIVLVSLLVSTGLIWQRVRRDLAQQTLLARLQRIASRVPGVIYEYQLRPDGSACFPYASEAIRGIYRVSPDTVREDATAVFSALHPEDLQRVQASIQRSATMLEPWSDEYRVKFPDGTVRELQGNAMPQRQTDGSVLWHGFIHDVTDIRQQERQLEALTERLRATVDAALDCIIVMDRQGRIVEFNPAAESCFGYRRDEVLGRLLSETLVPTDYRAAHDQGLRHYLETGEGPVLHRRIEIEALRKDGSVFPVELTIDVARCPSEQLFVSFLRDITERRKAEAEVREAADRHTNMLRAMKDAYWLIEGSTGRLLDVNRAAEEISGYNRDELLSMGAPDICIDLDVAAYAARMERLRRERWALIETRQRTKDGRTIDVEVSSLLDEKADRLIAFVRDITGRKQAETELRRREAQLRSESERNRLLLQIASDGIHILNAEGKIIIANESFAQGLGYTVEEVIGMHRAQWDALFGAEELDREILPSLFAKPDVFAFETKHRRKDGGLLDVEVATRAVTLDGQRLLFCSSRDITARKLIERELRLKEAELSKLALAASRTDNAVIFTDAAGRIEWVNEGFVRITGWHLGEVQGRKPGEFLQGPDTDPATIGYMSECIRVAKPFKVETINYRRDGASYWIAIEAQPILDDSGTLSGFMAIESDITERKSAQAALREYSQRLEGLVQARTRELEHNKVLLEAIVTTSPNGLLLVDRQGTIRYTNASLERMFGYDEQELVGVELEALVPESARSRHRELSRQFVQRPQNRSMGTMGADTELIGRRKDGSHFPIDVALAGVVVDDEHYVQATVADITTRKLAERALRDLNAELERKVAARTTELAAARDQAEQANLAKSEFLANMSHEIRTPMNGILGLAQLLEQEPLAPEQRDMVQRIRGAGRSLLGILNDILDFSKIEAGQLRIDREPFALAPLLHQLDSLMGATARGKGLGWHIQVPDEEDDIKLLGDVLRVEQILMNLVGNAVKFTARGGIDVRVRSRRVEASAIRVRFEVQDTGIGIPPAQLSQLFTPFTQADGSISRRFGGTGLGLSICKRLVELMGGEIGVDSVPEQGSTFWVELPFESAAAESVPAPRAPRPTPGVERLSDLRCLVVDDSPLNRIVVERMLAREGARVTVACDGQQALACLRADGAHFDIVLMDMQMPVMDGLTATRLIRDDAALKTLPIVALTAGVLAEQREAAQAAGCNDFLAKPVDLNDLVTVVLRSLQAPHTTVSEKPSSAAGFPAIPGLDIPYAASLLGGERAFFVSLLSDFASDFGSAADATRADLARGERASATQRLHSMKSAAEYIGALDLKQATERLEAAIHEEAPDLDERIADFDRKLSFLMDALADHRDE